MVTGAAAGGDALDGGVPAGAGIVASEVAVCAAAGELPVSAKASTAGIAQPVRLNMREALQIGAQNLPAGGPHDQPVSTARRRSLPDLATGQQSSSTRDAGVTRTH